MDTRKIPLEWFIGVLFIFLLARCYQISFFWNDGNILMSNPDGYEHLRRMTILYNSFPWIPAKDYYTGFPVGTSPLWPPLFDYIGVIMAWLTGGINKIPQSTFYMLPLLGAINVCLTYVTTKRLFGATAGLIAAFTYAILPVDIEISSVGDLDHHVVEVTMIFGLIWSVIESKKEGWRGVLPTAIIFALTPFMWRGATLMWGVMFLAVLVYRFVEKDTKPISRFSIGCLIASGFVAIASLTGFLGAFNEIRFNAPSWFQAIVLAGMGLTGIATTLPKKKAIATIAMLCLGAIPVLGSELLRGKSVVAGSNAWLDTIPGYNPMFWDVVNQTVSPWITIERLTIFYFAIPYVLFLMWKAYKKDKPAHDSLTVITIILAFSTMWILPIFKARYMLWLPGPIAICTGMLFSQLIAEKKWKDISSLVIGALIPLALFFYTKSIYPSIPPNHVVLHEALGWIKTNTPVTSGHKTGDIKPEYSVMANWDVGYLLTTVAERPSVGTNYGWETYGLIESTAFMTTGDSKVARSILDQCKSKYIIVSQSTDNDKAFNALSNIVKTDATAVEYKESIATTKDKSMSHRLLTEPGEVIPGVRLVYVAGAKQKTATKVFEVSKL